MTSWRPRGRGLESRRWYDGAGPSSAAAPTTRRFTAESYVGVSSAPLSKRRPARASSYVLAKGILWRRFIASEAPEQRREKECRCGPDADARLKRRVGGGYAQQDIQAPSISCIYPRSPLSSISTVGTVRALECRCRSDAGTGAPRPVGGGPWMTEAEDVRPRLLRHVRQGPAVGVGVPTTTASIFHA